MSDKKKKKITKEELERIPLLVATRLKAIHEPTGQEYELEFGKRVDYDEEGNSIIWYKTVVKKDQSP